ncbi:ricin-type beta-trefoil lectin domain protein [Streptomyces sp. MS06]|uniref:ricin-type beta-trefoil lectin domain protein n=1 Tax=Streptomyces sp. MS06 TaxID=3385974 RepID=UPI0039A3AEA8
MSPYRPGRPSLEPPVMWDCDNTNAQDWHFASDGTLRNGVGKCLNLEWAGTANGTKVESNDCHTEWRSKPWRYRADGSIYNPHSGRCLDVPNTHPERGTRPQLYDCNGAGNQKWDVHV